MDLTHDGGTEQVPGAIAAAPAIRWPGDLRPRVFISYRTQLSQEPARSLRRELEHHLPGQVFMDEVSLQAGWSWSQALVGALQDEWLKVVVCIIHPDFWTHRSDGSPTPRLWDENDVVLDELRIAVERWKKEQNISFNLILAPQDVGSEHPEIHEEIPPATRAVLQDLHAVHMNRDWVMSSPSGFDALVKKIIENVKELGALSHSDVKTFSHVLQLEPEERHGLRNNLEQQIGYGNREPRTVALAAALMVVDRDFDAGRDLLRKNEHVLVAPAGAAQYWGALAAAALAVSELRGERPRRLASLKLARELATKLLGALEALDANQGELRQDDDAKEAEPSVEDARSTQSVVAWALHAIVEDYFEGRGISLTPEGGVHQQERIDRILAWTRGLTSRDSIDEMAGLIPAPRGGYELESGAQVGGVGTW